ncbi:hypothetical protein [Halopseudomonas laoshanensis]|uniref:hypothetical protein n=1 Tax=Halopseudomonas laoshanensis TaxID=2268758 RepID=UPI00373526CB
MNTDLNKLLATVQAQTQAMQDLTGAINGLVETNRQLIDIVTGEELDEYEEPMVARYLDGTPIEEA